MPIHDYHCSGCGQDCELLVRSSTVPTCPHCGGTALERLLSLPAAPGTSRAIIAAGRRAAAREGHFSHYSRSEKSKLSK